ncbi:MAG TPA: hypothetical protein VIF11_09905 [Methylomirabilota bacterium]|jgi:hypothetical protein
MTPYPVRTRRWTRAEYERLIDVGVFHSREPLDRVLEIYRRPIADPSAPFGWRYASREVLSAESSVGLLAVPGARILVSDLLP